MAALLEPGEFVVSKAAAARNRRLLESINAGRLPVGLANGGLAEGGIAALGLRGPRYTTFARDRLAAQDHMRECNVLNRATREVALM